MIATDGGRGPLERGLEWRLNRSLSKDVGVDPGVRKVRSIETGGELAQGIVAAVADGVHDGRDIRVRLRRSQAVDPGPARIGVKRAPIHASERAHRITFSIGTTRMSRAPASLRAGTMRHS